MCLHCFVYLKLLSTHYNKALISVGLDLRKITKATLTLKSKQEKGTKSNLQMWNIFFFCPATDVSWLKDRLEKGINPLWVFHWEQGKVAKPCSASLTMGELCFKFWPGQRLGPEITRVWKQQKLLVLVLTMAVLSSSCSFSCYHFWWL